MNYELFIEVSTGVSKNNGKEYQCIRVYALYPSGKRHLIQTVFLSPQSNIQGVKYSIYGKSEK